MVSNCGKFYPYLVKDFYANLVIIPSVKDVLTTKVKNTEIFLGLEAFGICLGIPYKGQAFHHGLVPEWEGYSKMDFFFTFVVSHSKLSLVRRILPLFGYFCFQRT